VRNQVRKWHVADRHAQAGHVCEIRLGGFAGLVEVREDHFKFRTVLRMPGGDMTLSRAQLALAAINQVDCPMA
jgi:hypothetical protein